MADIKFWGLSTCIHCKRAKAYLEERGLDHDTVYVDQLGGEEKKSVIQEIKKHNPGLSFPTMIIDDTVVVGFHKDKIEEALGK